MKKYKGALTQEVRRAFDALAYAHLGEMLSEPAKREVVRDEPLDRTHVRIPSVTEGSSMPVVRRKQIALVVDRRIQPGALRYALNACMRLDADLEKLTNLAETEIAEALAREDIEPGLTCQVFQLGTDRFPQHCQTCASPHLHTLCSNQRYGCSGGQIRHGVSRRFGHPCTVARGFR